MNKQSYTSVIENEFKKYLLREEILGEKILLYIRILFSFIILPATFLFLKKKLYIPIASVILFFIIFISFYNALLFYLIKKGLYRWFVKYISAFIDISATSFILYIACIMQSPLAVFTTTAPFYLAILMVAANMRKSKAFTIFNIVYILICYNLVYFLNYPLLKEFSNNKLFYMTGLVGHFFKLLALLLLGVLLYLMLNLRLRHSKNFVSEIYYSRTVREELHRVYDGIIRSVSDGIIILDRNGFIRYSNRAAEKLTGLRYAELLGKNIFTILQPSGSNIKPRKEKMYDIELLTGEFKEFLLKKKDGRFIPVEVSSAPLKGMEGQRVFTIRDISLRKELEEELVQSKKMESIGRLTCGFAHDFNNLIMSMEENSKIIEKWFKKINKINTGKSISKYIQINRSITKKSKELVNQLLLLGKKESPVFKVVSTGEVLRGIENIIINMIPQNIELVVKNLLSGNKSYLLNETSLFQILMNLVVNSCDAIGGVEGRIEIKIEEGGIERFFELSEEGRFKINKRIIMPRERKNLLILCVSDSGQGIEEEKAFKIFEPYYTEKESRYRSGSGLGLSVVYTLIDNAGGGLVLKSTRGIGTEFCFCIPVRPVEPKEIGKIEDYELSNTGKSKTNRRMPVLTENAHMNQRSLDYNSKVEEEGSYTNKRILLIDDDENIRFFIRKMLEKMGFVVVEAVSGEEAKNLMEGRDDFSLAIVDYNLNWELEFDEIKKVAYTNGIPLVVMTGDVDENVLKTVDGVIVKAVLKKPFEDDDLSKVVIEHLK